MILAIFYLLVTPMLPTKFQVNWFGSGEEAKNRLQDGGHGSYIGFWIREILAIFYLQVIPMHLPSFKSTGLSVQEKKQKIDFQDGHHGGHLGFRTGTILVFFMYKSPRYFQVSSQLAFWFGRRISEKIFKMAAMAAILDFGSERF